MAGEDLGIISLDVNLADVERPPEIPVGRYVAEIQQIDRKTAANTGNEYYAMQFLIPAEQIPAEIAEHYEDGARMFYNRLLVPNSRDRRSLWNIKQFIEKLGLDVNTTEINPADWMNQNIGIVVGLEKNLEGEMRAVVKSLYAAEEAPSDVGEEDEEPEEAPAPRRTAKGGRRR